MLCDDGGKEKENVGFLFYFTKTNELVNFVKNIFGLKLNFEMHGKNVLFSFPISYRNTQQGGYVRMTSLIIIVIIIYYI